MNRLDYVLLKILKKKNCTSHFHSMTLQEIMGMSKSCRSTTSRKLKTLWEQLGWVKLNQLKGYASGIMKVPNDQLAWTQEQGEEAIVRNDGSILTPLSRDMSVLNADMTKNLWDFMGNPIGFLNDYSNGEKFGVKNESSSSVEVGGITIQCNMPNVQNSKDFLRELTTNKDVEKAIRAMTVDRLNGGSSLKKYKYRS